MSSRPSSYGGDSDYGFINVIFSKMNDTEKATFEEIANLIENM